MFFYSLIIFICLNHQIELASMLNTAAKLTESFFCCSFWFCSFFIILIMLTLV